MNNKKKSIGRTLLIGCAAFVFALCVLLGVFGFITYYNGMISKYQTYLRDVLQLSLSQIDNDDLKECISTKSKSASFEAVYDACSRQPFAHRSSWIS